MSDNVDAQERAQFMLRMRARGIQDLSLLRALERAPRSLFMPQRYQDIAARDIALPIGCGQTAPPPSIVASMIEALNLSRAHSIFEIGAGTGYATALLSQLAGQVLSVERCQTLALEASTRLEAFGVDNAQVAWADGLSPSAQVGPFDRIIVHGLIDSPDSLAQLLTPDGVLVAVMAEEGHEQRIVRLTRDGEGQIVTGDRGPARSFMRLAEGLTRGL
ncbi:protein-L-isoaspartate O-methyltransferase [Methylocapsa sp. S129]|uniref:protein-L-isoaspartate O-methyltransferase family protein n=1 Tax=Methylocapsa sp. S129 TaxID=1641869 RepID=UPI00131BC20D|nr:rRNA adenine N-6-methyltransferase family protein [Methylocapsa sp. S129]